MPKFYRKVFREFFPERTSVDFPAGYIPRRFFLEHIDRGPVLVVGDYEGRDYLAVKSKVDEACLLDIVDNGIAEKKLFFDQSITEPIPFPDGHFRYVLMAEVLEHVWEDKSALEEIRRVLSPDGKLLLSVPFFHDFPDHHYRIYSPKTILTLLRHSGFSVLKNNYRGLVHAIPNEFVALTALLLFPVFGKNALAKVNSFFYRLHDFLSDQKWPNSIFRSKYPFFRGYGVLIVAKRDEGPRVDPVQVQRESFGPKRARTP